MTADQPRDAAIAAQSPEEHDGGAGTLTLYDVVLVVVNEAER